MKIKELCETTAGAIASVANPVGSVIKRNMKNADITPLASTPGCLKKFLSSADKNELITFFGIELNGTNTLFSFEKSATKSPLPE